MSRSSVSVVVVASGTADVFRMCLGSLRRSLADADEVVCVVPDGRDDLLREASGAGWPSVVEDTTGRADAAWGTGVGATTRPIVVLVEGAVLAPPYWLDPVVAALDAPGVVAAAPRCHGGTGPQAADVPGPLLGDADAFAGFAAGWRERHAGRIDAVERLAPTCLAVRRDALAAAGGAGTDTLGERLREQGGLAVVHEALVAHLPGPAGAPEDELDAAAEVLARAHTSIDAGDYAAAAELCRDLLDGGGDDGFGGGVLEAALKTLMNSLIPLGELAEADEALRRLRDAAAGHEADAWEARLRFAEGDYAAAVAAARRLPDREQTRRDQLAEIEIKALFALGRHREAAEHLRACLTGGTLPLTIAEMAEALSADGTGLAEAVARVPEKQRRTLLYEARQAPVELADELLEALWAMPGEQTAVLGVAGHLGRLLPLHRALLWSARLRRHDLARHCPLLRIAAQPDRGAVERVLAAAVALERFGDDAALPLLEGALAQVPDEQEAAVLAELREHAPGIAASVEPARPAVPAVTGGGA